MEVFFVAYIITGAILMWIDRDKKAVVKVKKTIKKNLLYIEILRWIS